MKRMGILNKAYYGFNIKNRRKIKNTKFKW